MEEQKDIMVTHRLGEIPLDSPAEYLAHLLCLEGTCRYRFNERDFELHEGDLSIVRKRKLIENIHSSEDFRCKIIYAKPGFIELCTPQTNYGIKGSLALFLNPVMHLSPEQQNLGMKPYIDIAEKVKAEQMAIFENGQKG